MNKIKQNLPVILGAFFVFFLFLYITRLTPFAGDDWVYAINASGNPIVDAWKYYGFWSGRFMAEVFCHTVVLSKDFWDYFNAFQFSFLFILIYFLIKPKKNRLLVVVLIIGMIMGVKDQLRMQTYTFAIGAVTYLTSLLFVLPYIILLRLVILEKKIISKFGYTIISSVLCFLGCLFMQNLTIALLVLNFVIVAYTFMNNKSYFKSQLTIFMFTVISTMILMLSPGNTSRMIRDHSDWLSMSIMEQISFNWANFIKYTFLENKILIIVLILSLSVCCFKIMKKHHRKGLIGIGFLSIVSLHYMLIILTSVFPNLQIFQQLFNQESSSVALLINSIIYLGFTLLTYWILYQSLDTPLSLITIGALTFGGISNAVMMGTPIFAHRNSLYLVFALILIIGIIFSEFNLQKYFNIFFVLLLLLFICYKTKQWNYKYTVVDAIQKERMVIIQYYKDNPELLDIYIPRMPEYTIHSADIEPDDTTHQMYFKWFYGLNEEATIYMYMGELSK